jgi:hypothetical protein
MQKQKNGVFYVALAEMLTTTVGAMSGVQMSTAR